MPKESFLLMRPFRKSCLECKEATLFRDGDPTLTVPGTAILASSFPTRKALGGSQTPVPRIPLQNSPGG